MVECLHMTVGDQTSLLPSVVQRVECAGCPLNTAAWHSVDLVFLAYSLEVQGGKYRPRQDMIAEDSLVQDFSSFTGFVQAPLEAM